MTSHATNLPAPAIAAGRPLRKSSEPRMSALPSSNPEKSTTYGRGYAPYTPPPPQKRLSPTTNLFRIRASGQYPAGPSLRNRPVPVRQPSTGSETLILNSFRGVPALPCLQAYQLATKTTNIHENHQRRERKRDGRETRRKRSGTVRKRRRKETATEGNAYRRKNE
jgi:hypothetical protein